MTVDLVILEFWNLKFCAVWVNGTISSRTRLTCDCSAPRCGLRHRGFRRPRCHQMASCSAPLSSTFCGSFSSKWFRGIRVNRLTLNLFEPFFSTNSHLMPSWCIYRVHIAWIQTGENEWSQWMLSFKARGFHKREHRDFFILMQPHCRRQSEI